MPYDKVIDSALLDAGMTATANAIRKKTGGSSPIVWDSTNGFKTAVESIADGGVELPELGDTAAKPTDMVLGKVLYDDEGNPVTGTLGQTEVGTYAWAADDIIMVGDSGETTFNISGVYGKNYIGSDTIHGFVCRPGARFALRNVPTSLFGNATADQVAKGATFTSAAGLLVEGTHECEGGVTLPALTNPGAATDLAEGKELIDQNGNVVTGSVREIISNNLFMTQETSVGKANYVDGNSYVNIKANILADILMRKGSQFHAFAEFSEFGDAEASDVAKGKTFTSAAGLLVEGTMEAESGGVQMYVDGETLVITGAVTVENETLIL